MEKLHKLFNIPSYFNNLVLETHSENLMSLLNKDPIDYMRNLYSTDSKLFYNVRDELVLRGIGFRPEYKNNYLVERTYEIQHVLNKDDNTYAFEKIDFAILGANNFTERFKVKSDLFFKNIPLEGIHHFTQGISIVLLHNLFKEAGFSVVPVNEYTAKPIHSSGTYNGLGEKEGKPIDNLIKERSLREVLTDDILMPDASIKYYYKDPMFFTFRRYCNIKGIQKFSELTVDFIEKYQYQKHVRKEDMIKAMGLYHKIHRKYAMDFSVPDAIILLQKNSFRSIVEFINGDYKAFIDDFYATDKGKFHQTDYPFEKVQKVCQRAIKLSEENRLYNTMEFVMQDAVALLQDNSFKSVVGFIDGDYLAIMDDFYAADKLELYQADFSFEKAEQICRYAVDSSVEILAKKEQQQFDGLRLAIEDHPKFKYILSYSLAEIQEVFKVQWDKSLNLELYLLDVLEDINYKEVLKSILMKLNKMKDIRGILDNVTKKLKPRELKVLKLRRTKTLQEVGEIIKVTRERVRQVEAKSKGVLVSYKRSLNLKLYFQYCTEHSKLLTMDDFMQTFEIQGDLNKTVLEVFFASDDSITYLSELDRYILTTDYEGFRESIEKVDFSQPIIEIDELKQLFNEDVFNITGEVVDLLIQSRKYKRVNNFYIKERISIIARINYLFKHVIKEPLEMDDAGYDFFKQCMEDTFGLAFESNKRSATVRIAAGENVILVDNNTFAPHNGEAITDEFLGKIEEVIDEHLTVFDYVDPRWLYEKIRPLMDRIGLYSPVHLYSIIQLYLGDKYETGHGNTLYIFKLNSERLDAEMILLNYLHEHGHEAKRDSILEDLHWKGFKLDQLIPRVKTIVMVSNYTVKTIESFNFTDNELTELRNVIESELEKGYLFTYDLQFELAFNEGLGSLIERCKLTDDVTLAAIVKWLYPNINGHSKLLHLSDSPITRIEQIISVEFPEFVARNELLDFVESKDYGEQTVYRMPADILKDGLFYNYTNTRYINAELLTFNEEAKHSLASYLHQQFDSKSYCPIFDLVGYSQVLAPISSYEWTEYLIGQFAEQIGYRRIQTSIDYRFDKPVLVKKDMPIENFEQLVLHIVKTEYSGRYHEEDLAKYLVLKKVSHNPRRLTNEIYNSPLFKFDSFGFFEIRGETDGA